MRQTLTRSRESPAPAVALAVSAVIDQVSCGTDTTASWSSKRATAHDALGAVPYLAARIGCATEARPPGNVRPPTMPLADKYRPSLEWSRHVVALDAIFVAKRADGRFVERTSPTGPSWALRLLRSIRNQDIALHARVRVVKCASGRKRGSGATGSEGEEEHN
jgi:hypothetical protein